MRLKRPLRPWPGCSSVNVKRHLEPKFLFGVNLDPIILAFVAYILGGIGRTSYAFIFKALKDQAIRFDQKYWFTMLLSILLTIIASPVTFVNVVIPIGAETYIILTSFAMGWAANDIVNRPISFLASRENKPVE